MKVAFLGLGRMGRELVTHIIDAGHDVTVWNRTPAATTSVAARGAAVARSAGDAVKDAELVITVLFGPDTVREVVTAAELPFRQNAVWIDITTVSPDDATEFAHWAATRRIDYGHSPVIGSLGPARTRTLGVLLAGTQRALDVAEPIVSLWAEPGRLRIYASPALAAAGKLVVNLALAVSMQGLKEAIRMGQGGGMSTDQVLTQLQDKSPLASIAAAKGDTIRSQEFDDTQFSVRALSKDITLMLATTSDTLPAVLAAANSLAAAAAEGDGERDFSAIMAEKL